MGLEFVPGDEEFEEALDRYLVRLEGRAERRLLVRGQRQALLLAACGYQVERADNLPDPQGAAFQRLHALVLPAADLPEGRGWARAAGLPAGAVAMDGDRDLDRVLRTLDASL